MDGSSLALLALCCLLNHRLLLQWGPQGKGAVDDLVVVSLTAEAPASRCLGCCSIQYGYIKLLVEGAQRQVVNCALVSELGIIAQDCCPSGNAGLDRRCVSGNATAPCICGIETEQSILIYMPRTQPEL